jgi:predicted ABC-type exoprotein transport system permease subunit
MKYFFLLITLLTGFYAYTYARWLKQKTGNKAGAIGIFALISLGVAVAVYRIVAQ